MLLAAVAAGVLWPSRGAAAASAGGVELATRLVFLLTGLGLRRRDLADAARCPGAAAYGCAASLGLSPLLAAALLRTAPHWLPPGLPHELVAGLAVMLCVPTALSTGVVLTQQAGANAALCLLLVVLTNAAGVATIPLALQAVFGGAAAAAGLSSPLPAVDSGALFGSLLRSVAAPLAAGAAAAALVPGLADYWDARCVKPARSLQQACLVATPWSAWPHETRGRVGRRGCVFAVCCV